MQIVYGFVYYFVIFLVAITLALLAFVFSPARRLLHRFRTRFSNIFQNQFVKYGIYLIFAVILLILFESIFTFSTLKSHFKRKSKYNPQEVQEVGIEDLDVMSAQNRQNYLLQLKQYREYYMAQRNIMLTFAALFIFFAFHRILHSIVRYSETQHRLTVIDNANSLHLSQRKYQ